MNDDYSGVAITDEESARCLGEFRDICDRMVDWARRWQHQIRRIEHDGMDTPIGSRFASVLELLAGAMEKAERCEL